MANGSTSRSASASACARSASAAAAWVVDEFAVRECCEEVRLNDCHVSDGWGLAVKDILDGGQGSFRVALGEADSRAGIPDLGVGGQFRIEGRQRGPGLAELSETGLGG